MTIPDPSRQMWFESIVSKAPAYLELFLGSPETTLTLINHENGSIRSAAILAAYAIWNMDRNSRFVDECCRVAAQDIDVEPRTTAIVILGNVFENSQDRNVQRSLAQVVIDTNASNFTRNYAFRTMLDVEYGWVSFDELLRETDELLRDAEAVIARQPVKLDIDWDFVQSKLDAK